MINFYVQSLIRYSPVGSESVSRSLGATPEPAPPTAKDQPSGTTQKSDPVGMFEYIHILLVNLI
jgi:hypothetical protein